MRIGYFADGKWAHLALEGLIADPRFEIAFIVPRFDSQDPVLRQYAEKLGVPYIVHPDVNSAEFFQLAGELGADIFVSMSFNQILKRPIIELPPKGFINCHAGALPFYRGRNILNWALINGESRFGVTVHYVDEGVDTGDIIVQEFGEIGITDTYEELLNKAVGLCAETLCKALRAIANDEVKRIPQASMGSAGFYCGMRRPGDEWLDWQWSSKRVYDFIRGISLPGPCARTTCEDKTLAIVRSEWMADVPAYIGTPGEVVGRTSRGNFVKTGDSTLYVTQVADISHEGGVVNLRVPDFRVGTRFGLSHSRVYDLQRRISQLEKEVLQMKDLIGKFVK